jgi:hypothetical protein
MVLRRGLRRIYARWRLHRMEWNGMHAPLMPPPGYEKYTELREALPGLQDVQPVQSFAHFKILMAESWKLYMHHYIPDPDIVREEEAAEEKKWSKRDADIAAIAKEHAKLRRKTKKIMTNARQHIPMAQEALSGRLAILNESLNEFMVGFKEASSGQVDALGRVRYSPDIIHPENAPLVYRVGDAVDSPAHEI